MWALLALGRQRCPVTHPTVAVLDARPDLAGVWQGSYESRDTGRFGDIVLALTADGDSAVGEVVMVPRGTAVTVASADERWRWKGVTRPQVLTIRFVRVGRGGRRRARPLPRPRLRVLVADHVPGAVEGDRWSAVRVACRGRVHDAEGTWLARPTARPVTVPVLDPPVPSQAPHPHAQ